MIGRMRSRLLAVALTAFAANGLSATAGASFTQEPGSPFDVGVRPTGVFAADFNVDGRPDLLTIDESSVSVLLRRPTGGYELEGGASIPVGGGPSGAAIADFNGDGRLDVVVSLFADLDRTIVVLLRQPTGGFAQEGAALDFDWRAQGLVAGDFTGDSAPDLAVASWDFGEVRILRRDPGAFVLLPAGLPTESHPRSVVAANFDGAGGSDLAVTNNASGSVTLLLRQGGGFTEETGSPFTAGDHPEGIVARDFNADGRPDLAVANSFDDNVTVLLRQSGGGFAQAPASPGVGDGPVGIASGDFNSDGRPDLVTANQFASTASVLLQTAAGAWAPDPSSPVATDTGATGVAVTDADADGRPDLAVANYTDSSVSVLLNTTPFPPPPPPPPPPNLDVDGDGVQRPLDCDDGNPAVKPGAPDKPGDGIDQDCAGGDAPYPVLDRRISAFLATYQRYTKFTSLSVKKVRAGDTVRLTCREGGCPLRSKTIRVKRDRKQLPLIRRFRGAKLRRGAVVTLRVTRPETVGRFVSWKMRSPKLPKRRDACLPPGAKRPQACPD